MISINMKLINRLEDTQFEKKEITHTREISRGVILNEKNEVAILKLYANDKFGLRDCYELPGGGVKEGESFLDAFKREAIEEVGYEVEVISEIGDVIDFYNLINRENHNHYFLGKTTKYLGIQMEEYEKTMIQKIEFVPIDIAIDLFEHRMFGHVGILVQQRELPILKIAKTMIESLKN